jgi:hypothetical protein
MEVMDRREVVDLDEVRTRRDMAGLTAGRIVEPDVTAIRVVFNAADEEGIIRGLARLSACRQCDQQEDQEESRYEVAQASLQRAQGTSDPCGRKGAHPGMS